MLGALDGSPCPGPLDAVVLAAPGWPFRHTARACLPSSTRLDLVIKELHALAGPQQRRASRVRGKLRHKASFLERASREQPAARRTAAAEQPRARRPTSAARWRGTPAGVRASHKTYNDRSPDRSVVPGRLVVVLLGEAARGARVSRARLIGAPPCANNSTYRRLRRNLGSMPFCDV
jgi:hypothetical protein